MHILIFTLQYPPETGGVQTMAYQLSKHLALAGAEPVVLAPYMPGCAAFDERQNFRTIRLRLGESGNAINQLRQKIRLLNDYIRTVKKVKPDAILCVHWDPLAYIARAAAILNKDFPPYFLNAHGMELAQLPRNRIAKWGKSKLRTFGFKGAHRVVAGSNYTRNRAISLGISPKHLTVIPYGVEVSEQSAQDTETAKPQSPGKMLLTLSRLVPRKGHDTVLRALPTIRNCFPEVIYHIAGSGPERGRLERLSSELGLADSVVFHSEVSEEEKNRLLAACDVFVLPCRETPTDFEGFGIAFLEAMNLGIPVIGGNSGGVPDAIEHGQTGLLVNPNDPEALAKAVLELLRSPSECLRLGRNGRQSVQDKFNWPSIARLYQAELRPYIITPSSKQ